MDEQRRGVCLVRDTRFIKGGEPALLASYHWDQEDDAKEQAQKMSTLPPSAPPMNQSLDTAAMSNAQSDPSDVEHNGVVSSTE